MVTRFEKTSNIVLRSSTENVFFIFFITQFFFSSTFEMFLSHSIPPREHLHLSSFLSLVFAFRKFYLRNCTLEICSLLLNSKLLETCEKSDFKTTYRKCLLHLSLLSISAKVYCSISLKMCRKI